MQAIKFHSGLKYIQNNFDWCYMIRWHIYKSRIIVEYYLELRAKDPEEAEEWIAQELVQSSDKVNHMVRDLLKDKS